MNTWNGNVIIDGKEINITVYYTKPSLNTFGEWHGYGYCENINFDTYYTTIGVMIVNHISFDSGNCYFKFVGSGMPEGELKEAME